MRRNVIGHFRDTLMAVCSTPSSPLRVVLPDEAATLLKFLLTVGWEAQVHKEHRAILHMPPYPHGAKTPASPPPPKHWEVLARTAVHPAWAMVSLTCQVLWATQYFGKAAPRCDVWSTHAPAGGHVSSLAYAELVPPLPPPFTGKGDFLQNFQRPSLALLWFSMFVDEPATPQILLYLILQV